MKLTIDGLSFEARIEGPEGAPVLMLSNSLASNLSMWDPQVPAFAARYRVLRYDQRGHGGTQAPTRPVSIDRLADDAVAILDALGIERAHFCGLSMGGMTGMNLLARRRDRIGRAVLANTAARMGPPDLWNGRIRAVRAGGMAAVVDATLARWMTPAFRERAPETAAAVRAMVLATPPEGYAACCAAIRDMDQREAIRGVAAPTLVIVGAHDPATTPAAGALVQGAIRGARLLSLDAAHLSNLERPDAFSRAVLDFLDEG